MMYRETITWPPVREEEVLARVTGAEEKKSIVLSDHANVAPVEAVPVDPSKGVTQNQKVYRAGTVLAKITMNVGGGEDELGKYGPYDETQAHDGRDAALVAYLVTGVVGNNNAIRFSAKEPGLYGRQITVELDDPSGNNQALAVVVSGLDIHVDLATGPGGAITSTAAQVIAAVNASAAASRLVQAANQGASTGVGVVTATSKTNLADNVASVEIAVLPTDVNVQFGAVVAGVYVANCVFNSGKLIGYSGHEANLKAALAARNCQVETVTLVS